MRDFFDAAMPWIAIGLALAIFFVSMTNKKQDNYGLTGLCVGMCIGLAIQPQYGMCVGMLMGYAVGLSTRKAISKK